MLLLQSGELSCVVVMKTLPISVALKQQRFIPHTHRIYVCLLWSRHSGIWAEWNSQSWTFLMVTPRERALGGLATTCSSQWWVHVPSVHHPSSSRVRNCGHTSTRGCRRSVFLLWSGKRTQQCWWLPHLCWSNMYFYLLIKNLGAHLWIFPNMLVGWEPLI